MEKVKWISINEKQNGLEYSKMKNHPPSPKRGPVTDPSGKTDETGENLSLPNLNTIIINKI